MINSLLKPHYKIMKHLEKEETAQNHFETFTLRNNLRVFQRGKRKGYSPLQLEGVRTQINDWTELIWGETSEETMKEIETSALMGNLQKQKDADNYSNSSQSFLPNPGQEGCDAIEVDKEEREAFVVETGKPNKWVQ